MSDWITDRRPTKADCREYTDGVLLWQEGGGVEIVWHEGVRHGQPWMPLPPPYQPPPAPEPDMSLAASIERMWSYAVGGSGAAEYWDSRLHDDDLQRIIDAARRWDDSMRTTTELADAVADDPDGVGEGWRLLREGEVIRKGDQFELDDRWYDTHDPGMTRFDTATRRRRRIEAEHLSKLES